MSLCLFYSRSAFVSSLARLCGELMEHCLLMPVSGGVASPLRVLFRICHTCHTCLSTHCQSRLARLPFCPFCSPQSPVAAACIRSCSSDSSQSQSAYVQCAFMFYYLLCFALLCFVCISWIASLLLSTPASVSYNHNPVARILYL